MRSRAGIAIWLMACVLVASRLHAREVKSPDLTPADRDSKALVLLSTAADRRSLASSTSLMLIRVERKGEKRKHKALHSFVMNHPIADSHSPTSIMNVHWRALEPGEYILKRVLANAVACYQVRIAYEFNLTAGQQLYLGEFAVEGDDMNVHDAYQRDYDYFIAHSGGEHPPAFTRALPEKTVRDNSDCRPMSPN